MLRGTGWLGGDEDATDQAGFPVDAACSQGPSSGLPEVRYEGMPGRCRLAALVMRVLRAVGLAAGVAAGVVVFVAFVVAVVLFGGGG